MDDAIVLIDCTALLMKYWALLMECRSLLKINGALLIEYGALHMACTQFPTPLDFSLGRYDCFMECRALLIKCRALLMKCKALLMALEALLKEHRALLTAYTQFPTPLHLSRCKIRLV